jgi:drug/metabolite transporter (DMT)-like permease
LSVIGYPITPIDQKPYIQKPAVSDAQNNLNVVIRYIGYLNPLTLHRRGTRAKALFALALVCFFWGTTWLASKEAVRHMPPMQLAGVRQFLGGACYVIFFLLKGTAWPRKKDWIPIIILSFLNFVLSNGLSTWGVKYISAGLGSVIGAIFPLWLVVIGLFSGNARIQPRSIIGLLLGFAGICVIFYDHLYDFLDPSFRLGIFMSVISTWSWAFGTLYTKKHALHFNPYFGLGLQMVISGSSLFTLSHATGIAMPITEIAWQAWASIAYLVVFGSIIGFAAYIYALQNLPTEQASLYAYINPIVAVFFGWLVFGEKLTGFIIVGTLITMLGVYLVNKSFMKPTVADKQEK